VLYFHSPLVAINASSSSSRLGRRERNDKKTSECFTIIIIASFLRIAAAVAAFAASTTET